MGFISYSRSYLYK